MFEAHDASFPDWGDLDQWLTEFDADSASFAAGESLTPQQREIRRSIVASLPQPENHYDKRLRAKEREAQAEHAKQAAQAVHVALR